MEYEERALRLAVLINNQIDLNNDLQPAKTAKIKLITIPQL
jgi:hypothetical protein